MLGRRTRFAAGFLIGLFSLPVLALIYFVLVLLAAEAGAPAQGQEIPATFSTDGSSVTRSGGAIVIVRGLDESMTRLTCRDTCDDLVSWSTFAERVEVKTADSPASSVRSKD